MAKKNKKKMNRHPSSVGSDRSYENISVLDAMIRQTYQRFAQSYKERLRSRAPTDYDPVRLKRRIRATSSYVPQARALAGNICPTIPDYFYLEEEWAEINALPLTTYDALEDQSAISLAAAIWILDRIDEAGKLMELKRMLPQNRMEIERACLQYYPSIWDTSYEEELIWAVAYVLRNRNKDCVGIPVKKGDSLKTNAIMDDYTAMGKQHQDVPSRRQFEGMLALIPDVVRQNAERHFEEKLWEITERYFRARSITAREEADNAKKLVDLQSRVSEHMEKFLRREVPPAPLNAALSGATFSSGGAKARLDQMLNNPLQYLSHNADIEQQLEDEAKAILERASRLAWAVSTMASCAPESYVNGIGAEAAQCLKGYTVGDPYEMCFALFSLLDQDSELPWLYFAGTALMKNVCATLPWFDGDFCDYDDPVWDYDAAATKPKKPSDLPDFYAMEYTDNRENSEFLSYSNLAQIVYNLTGAIMPRDLHRYDVVLPELRHYGITGKKLQAQLLLCMGILGETQRQTDCSYYDFSELELFEAENDTDRGAEESEITANADQTNALQNKVSQLQAELKQMKRMLYEAEKATRDAQANISSLQKKSEEEKQELADLREIVFRQENEIEEKLETDSHISLPYEVQNRTVVFGGHETWAKAIKPMLTGKIRFVDRNMQPNADLIRHASVVWLQSNSMSHRNYYAIMNTVRANDIPLRYFTFASAEKCALQLAEADRLTAKR